MSKWSKYDIDMDAIKTIVQTKSLLTVLELIATQVKKLMATKENIAEASSNDAKVDLETKNQSVENLLNSIAKFLTASSSLDQNDLKESKEILTEIGQDFKISLHCLSRKINDEVAWMKLEESGKKLLHAIIKITLANDDISIAKITKTLTETKGHFIKFLNAHELTMEEDRFQTFLKWMLNSSQLLSKRYLEIVCPDSKRTLSTNVFFIVQLSSILKQIFPICSASPNQQYQDLKLFLGDEVLRSISILIETIQRGTWSARPRNSFFIDSNTFAFSIQKILARLSSDIAWETDFDNLIRLVIKHSLRIADLSCQQPQDSKLITGVANEVAKLHEQLKSSSDFLTQRNAAVLRIQSRIDRNNLLDELENLEYHVNLATLNIIMESFLQIKQPETLECALYEITTNAERVFQACTLIAESSTNINRICSVVASVNLLRLLYNQLTRTENKEILEFLVRNYFKQLSCIANLLNAIADPAAVVNISLPKLDQAISQLKQILYTQNVHDMSPIVNKIIGRAKKVHGVLRWNSPSALRDSEDLISNLDTAIYALEASHLRQQQNVADLQAHRSVYKHAKIVLNCITKLDAKFQAQYRDLMSTCTNSGKSRNYNYQSIFACNDDSDAIEMDAKTQRAYGTLCNNLTEALEDLMELDGTFTSAQSTITTKQTPLPSDSSDENPMSQSSALITTPERLADIERIVQKMYELQIQPISGFSKENYHFL